MADMTANPPRGVLSAPPRAPTKSPLGASGGDAPTWGSLPGAARPWAQGQHRPADRIPPRVTASNPAPEAPDDLADDWGADPVFGSTAASVALAGFNAVEARRFQGARTGLFLGGGVLSLALVGLIGVWGYKVVLREVLGVPVVAAEAGPMRVEPAEPGGVITADAGLSVNAVAADGTAAPPSDVLTLAPPTSDLAPEDMEVAQTDAEAGEVRPQAAPVEAARAAIAEAQDLVEATPAVATPTVATQAITPQAVATPAAAPAPIQATLTATLLPVEGAMTPEQVLAFADSVAAGTPPLAPVAEAAVVPAAAPVTRLAADVPGVAVAVRPPARPASAPVGPVEAVTLTAAEVPVPAEEPEAIALTASIPAGTNLVQLGAFDSAAIAASEWERLQGPFGEFLDGKERVIQEAESGGRTFFRLRAMGFEDLAAARRLCAALVAEDAGCIPVVVQ